MVEISFAVDVRNLEGGAADGRDTKAGGRSKYHIGRTMESHLKVRVIRIESDRGGSALKSDRIAKTYISAVDIVKR